MGTYFTKPPALIDGDTAFADDVNVLSDRTDAGFLLVEAATVGWEPVISAYTDKAEEWAENPEDSEVDPGQYSALHHAAKAATSASTAITQAGIATTKASEASASALSTHNEATEAEASNSEAGASASLAAGHASDALDYRNAASASAGNAAISENNALGYRNQAAASAITATTQAGLALDAISVGLSMTSVDDISALAAYTGDHTAVYIRGRSTDSDGGQGIFIWNSSDLSTEVSVDTLHGIYVPPSSDTSGNSGAWVRQYTGPVDILWFASNAVPGTTDMSSALSLAFSLSLNVYANGVFAIGSTVVWPAGYGWRLQGEKGTTKFIALSDIGILTSPSDSGGQFGSIDGIIFSSSVAGNGTGIRGTTASYIAHLTVTNCDFRNSLKFGIDGDLINCDINGNKFGYDDIGESSFSAIKTVGVYGGNESNFNRIRNNEITACIGTNALLATGGFHLVLEGNTFENNSTTGPVIRTDITSTYFYKNWFEANGAVATVSFFTTSGNVSVVNVFEGNLFNAKLQSAPCYFDITDMTGSKSLVMRNNLFTGCPKIVKNDATYDELSVVALVTNNFIVTGDGSISPYAPNGAIDGGGYDVGFAGNVKISSSLSVLGNASVTGSISSQLATDIDGIATATPTTIFTLPTLAVPSVYLISVISHRIDVENFGAFAVVLVDTSSGTTVTRFPVSSDGAVMTITMSGLDVVVTQTSGGTINNLYASAVRIL